ncbi:hypothetical protein HPB51_010807 [Rhipicephalus microplus]|uniref:Uncharacterized protein n=1 Tax=Rhipicephalus microplus TaxID=6941 RepID=A0A9J6ETE0_RHIMP|nr:hypothetical protein HPB51_010807 [Rhipicephalus microplus]
MAEFIDATKHQYRPHTYAAVVVRATDGKLLNACSIQATSAELAEEAAITLALYGTPEVTTILSVCRTAIANLGRGSIGTPTASLLPRSKSSTTHLRWFPVLVGALSGGYRCTRARAPCGPPIPPPRMRTKPNSWTRTRHSNTAAFFNGTERATERRASTEAEAAPGDPPETTTDRHWSHARTGPTGVPQPLRKCEVW